jgi:signal transduction histidine kinase
MRPLGSSTEKELLERQSWFIRLRWLAILGLLVGVYISTAILKLEYKILPILILASTLILLNCVYLAASRSLRRFPIEYIESGYAGSLLVPARTLSNIQISLDLVILTILVYYTGGIESPIQAFYIFHIIISANLLSRTAAYLQALLVCVLYSALVILEYCRCLPHYHIEGGLTGHFYDQGIYIFMSLVVFIMVISASVYMATSITRRLRSREMQLDNVLAELKTANTRLADLDKMRAMSMRQIEHEMKAPLSAVQSNLMVLNDVFTKQLEGKPLELLRRALDRTNMLKELLVELVLLSKLRDSKDVLSERKRLSLCTLVAEILESFLDQSGLKQQSVDFQICEEDSEVTADEEGLRTVFRNLIGNAIKYTPEGGEIGITGQRTDEFFEISVSDTGIGIPEEDQARIFNDFFRADNAKQSKIDGTGLGLVISRNIIEQHGGKINFTSEEGEGTTFTVSLPV